jgi:DNA polymerase III sliding clamp (beta) subunit (PCNA family)
MAASGNRRGIGQRFRWAGKCRRFWKGHRRPMQMLKAIIPATDFLFVSRFSSNEETRYYLNGVFVHLGSRDKAVRLVATDGHRLGVLRLAHNEGEGDPKAESFIISSQKDILRACKGRQHDRLWLRCFDDRLEIIDVGTVEATPEDIKAYTGVVKVTFPAASTYIDGTFPDYERVIPEKLSGKRGKQGVNATYVAPFAVDGKSSKGIVIGFNDDAPMIVTNTDPRFLGVLMPMRFDMSDDDILARRRHVLGLPEQTKLKAVA